MKWPVNRKTAPLSLMNIPLIEQGVVHVWTLDLDNDAVNGFCDCSRLSDDEHVRAARYRLPLLRNRFIRSRTCLRLLLGCYLGKEAGSIRFAYGKYGKPHIPDVSELHFNISHSENIMMAAFAKNSEVGVDIVSETPLSDAEGISQLIFSARENEACALLPSPERQSAFFRIWARKEACIKAQGKSLALHSTSFSVSVQPGLSNEMVKVDGLKKIHLSDIDTPAGFCAALAIEGADWHVCSFSGFERHIMLY